MAWRRRGKQAHFSAKVDVDLPNNERLTGERTVTYWYEGADRQHRGKYRLWKI